MKKKTIALIASCAMLFGVATGGTLAWLTATDDAVVNTFTPAGIEITLTETMNTDSTPNDDKNENDKWEAQLVPGKEYTKNPVVAVDGTKTDIDCYLFVRVVEEGNPSQYLDYSHAFSSNGWGQVPDTTDVWYRIVKKDDPTKEWHLMTDDKVKVKETLKKEEMPTNSSTVSITYEAYAIQEEGFGTDKIKDAWTKAYAQKTDKQS